MNRLRKALVGSHRYLIVLGCAVLLLHTASLNSEVPPDDQQGFNPSFGGPESIPFPPTTDGEEENFIDPNNNMGFPTPPPITDSSQEPIIPSTEPPVNVQQPPEIAAPPSMARQRSSPLPPMQTPPSQPTFNKAQSSAPKKLADYLELNSSVKSLEVKNFDLPDKEIRDVVTLISKWTGKNFILDSKVRGKITILGPSAVTLDEAYRAFLAALEANNLTTVQKGKFIQVIESAEARRSPIETYAGDYAPDTDQFITRILQLKYINADEVQREFRDLASRQGKLFAYEPTNSIIITDTGANIARIQQILTSIDVKGFETTLHVLRIRNTSSKAISEMLGEIYGDSSGGRPTGTPRTFRRSSLERTRGGGIISKIIPDEQTNSLVVLANQAGFNQLKQLVAKLDIKVTDTGRIHVYYCEYAKAEDLAATLAALSGGGTGTGRSGTRTNTVSGTSIAGGTTGAALGSGRATPATPVTAELDGGVKITSDASTNSLVVTANSGDYQTLKRVIKKLDIPRLQVFVETAILEVVVDNNSNIGTNFGVGSNRGLVGSFISDQKSVLSFLTGTPQEGTAIPFFAGDIFKAPNPAGGDPIEVTSFMGFLKLLMANTNTSVLSTPQIIALDNEKAEFKVLDETPVQTTFTAGLGQNAGLAGVAQGSIERLKTGIQIKLTPHINAASKSIRLELEQQVDSTKGSSAVPQALAGVQVATTSRVTNTSVVVKDQDYVILGGLMQDKVDESIKKVPLLGDIPILGWLFKARDYRVTKTNLVILLRPRIIGTGVAAASIIDDRLRGRDKFIDDNLDGEDANRDGVDQIKRSIKRQQESSELDPLDQYRNNQDDEDSEELSPGAPVQGAKTSAKDALQVAPPLLPTTDKPQEPAVTPPAEPTQGG